ncbi:MAG: Holliday junction DNA helicase RuvA [Pirellulaceae bacterium]|jgi:holliday junction DNA helicase RuvA|nr:Holliday junction DNA helicase RuvA [Pirellulaceae bacterium]
MICKLTGNLLHLGEEVATIAVEPFEYQVLIPDFTRRHLQALVGSPISLHTIHYLEGNPQKGGRMVPRLVGFLSEVEREFFEQFCSVDGVGVKKALRAMVRPVQDIAKAIEQQDFKSVSTLPGIGAAMSERIVAKLRRKMGKFALLVSRDESGIVDQAQHSVVDDTYLILCSLGHSEADARQLLDAALATKKKFKDVDELLQAVYDNSSAAKT